MLRDYIRLTPKLLELFWADFSVLAIVCSFKGFHSYGFKLWIAPPMIEDTFHSLFITCNIPIAHKYMLRISIPFSTASAWNEMVQSKLEVIHQERKGS